MKKLRKWGTTEISRAKRRIQKLLTQLVRIRDGGCIFRKFPQTGRCSGFTAADHIISRSRTASYGISLNVVCVCSYHHIWWKPSNPTIYTEIVKNYLGEDYQRLHLLQNATARYSIKDWLKVEEALKAEILTLNN